MLGTTTVTPRPSVSRWRARPSSASALLVTEEMDATVTVSLSALYLCMHVHSVLLMKSFWIGCAALWQCKGFPPFCLVQWCLSPTHTYTHKHMQTKLKTVQGSASVFRQHLSVQRRGVKYRLDGGNHLCSRLSFFSSLRPILPLPPPPVNSVVNRDWCVACH